jgi:hypothetical protein
MGFVEDCLLIVNLLGNSRWKTLNILVKLVKHLNACRFLTYLAAIDIFLGIVNGIDPIFLNLILVVV